MDDERESKQKMKKQRSIGLDVKAPETKCDDKKCPFHGHLKVRGREFMGLVVESKGYKSATVEWERQVFIPKYERYEKRKTRIRVHNPSCINAKKSDFVRIAETRRLSKTKSFVIIEKIGTERVFGPSMDETLDKRHEKKEEVKKTKAKVKDESA